MLNTFLPIEKQVNTANLPGNFIPIDPRLHNIVAAQPYPLLFATISSAHLYGFGFPSPPQISCPNYDVHFED